jgi:molecular chaperone Hsp33
MCGCNSARLENLLSLLPIDELQDMATNGPFPLEVRCKNCNTPYTFSRSDLQTIYGRRFAAN